MNRLIWFFVSIFVILSYIIITQGFIPIDTLVSANISSIYSDSLTMLMKTISTIGAMKECLALSFVFVLWLVYKKRWIDKAKVYTLSLLFSIVSFAIIKQIIARPRPHSILVDAHNYSFPSGHSTMAMAMALGVYFVFVDKIKYKFLWLLVAISWALLVGFSRIYLNVHWVSDVLAGFSLGIVCALLSKLYVDSKLK